MNELPHGASQAVEPTAAFFEEIHACFRLALKAKNSEDKAFWLRLADYMLSLSSGKP